jgi:hypothetical protein
VEAGYAQNPEDQAGYPQQANRSKTALITDLGRMALRGILGQRQDSSGRHRESELGSSLALSQTQRLYGGYLLTGDISANCTAYRLGYSSNRGPILQLCLEGQLLLLDEGDLATERTETRIEAKLSARF